ncbi:hypothetical protein R3P38DRAFT_3595058 [Favolaschia claudopus]|uniref:Uncharacterized protein n=1 Tax=Favolaschia claudopus TaxID=2862362 RepID=A0AAW0DL19_9AGAR
MEPSKLNSSCLNNLTLAQLKALIKAVVPHLRAAPNMGLAQARSTVDSLNVFVNWDKLVDETPESDTALETLLRKHVKDGNVTRPSNTGASSPLTPSPEEQSPKTILTTGALQKLSDALDKYNMQPVIDAFRERRLLFKGTALLKALEPQLPDQLWKLGILIKDCSQEIGNMSTYLYCASELAIHPLDYGNDSELSSAAYYVQAQELVDFLQQYNLLPPPPWDVFWVIPGWNWMIGPFARSVTGSEIGFDHSKVQLRRGLVHGPDSALRIMILFRHPHDASDSVPGFQDTDSVSALQNCLPLFDGALWNAIKVETREDVKPTISGSSKDGNKAIGQAVRELLIKETKKGATLQDMVSLGARQAGSIQQTHRWVKCLGQLMQDHQRTRSIPGYSPRIPDKKFNDQIWAEVAGHGVTWFTHAKAAYNALQNSSFELTPEAEAFFANDSVRTSMADFAKHISEKYWLSKEYALKMAGAERGEDEAAAERGEDNENIDEK